MSKSYLPKRARASHPRPTVSFVSRADDISELLKTYRELSTGLVAAANLFILLPLWVRRRL